MESVLDSTKQMRGSNKGQSTKEIRGQQNKPRTQ
jgi:hypothetical protein